MLKFKVNEGKMLCGVEFIGPFHGHGHGQGHGHVLSDVTKMHRVR